jgi:hypothetical protein
VRIVTDSTPESPRTWCNLGTMACWHRRYNLGDEQQRQPLRAWLCDLAIEACPRLGDLIDYWDHDGYDQLREQYGSHEATAAAVKEHVDELIAAVIDWHYAMLPLYLYDHSGITMSTTRFSCPWDSGQVGWIYCSLAEARKNWGLDKSAGWSTRVNYPDGPITLREATKRVLRGEVETYDQFISGEVYGFIVEEGRACEACGNEQWDEVDSCWGFFGRDPDENGMAEHLGDEALVEMAREAEIEYWP